MPQRSFTRIAAKPSTSAKQEGLGVGHAQECAEKGRLNPDGKGGLGVGHGGEGAGGGGHAPVGAVLLR